MKKIGVHGDQAVLNSSSSSYGNIVMGRACGGNTPGSGTFWFICCNSLQGCWLDQLGLMTVLLKKLCNAH